MKIVKNLMKKKFIKILFTSVLASPFSVFGFADNTTGRYVKSGNSQVTLYEKQTDESYRWIHQTSVTQLPDTMKVRITSYDWTEGVTRATFYNCYRLLLPNGNPTDQWQAWDGYNVRKVSTIPGTLVGGETNYFSAPVVGPPIYETSSTPFNAGTYTYAGALKIVAYQSSTMEVWNTTLNTHYQVRFYFRPPTGFQTHEVDVCVGPGETETISPTYPGASWAGYRDSISAFLTSCPQ